MPTIKSDNSPVLTLAQAAKFLGVQPVTLRKWDNEGKLKAIRIGERGDRRYLREDLAVFLDRSKQNHIEWQEYIRNGVSCRVAFPIIDAMISTEMDAYFGTHYLYFMGFIRDNTVYWNYDISDNRRMGETVAHRYGTDLKFRKEVKLQWDKFHTVLIKESEEVMCNNLENWPLEELIRRFEKLYRLNRDFYAFSISIDGIDEIVQLKMQETIKKSASRLKVEYSVVFNALTIPIELSANAHKEIELLELALQIKNNQIEVDSDFVKNKVKSIADTYWWLDMNWGKTELNALDITWKNLLELLSGKIDTEKRLVGLRRYSQNAKEQRAVYIGKLKLANNKDFSLLLRVMDDFIVYHDWRKEVQMKQSYAELMMMKELAKRLKIGLNILECCHPEEIIRLAKGESLDLQAIYQRLNGYLILVKNNQRKDYVGMEAEVRYIGEKKLSQHSATDLQGINASMGKATGEAFVAMSSVEAEKIKPGQILITSMTSPDFIQAMKKAAAVVTDEGGITSHAAILSRELGIPCIVGTKYATRILKTGQMIEVRANHGVVAILDK